MDYATRNKRFLAEACEANGLPITGSPAELFATLSARSVVSVKRVKPLDMGPLIKAVHVQAAMLHKKPVTDTLSLDSTMLALQDVISGKKKLSVDDFTGLVAPLIEKLDSVLPEDSKHVLRNLLSSHITTDTSAAIAQESHADMGIVRRRLMDWLVINTTSERGRMLKWVNADGTLSPPALYVIAGLHDNEEMEAVASGLMNNPRLVASKLAYSIFPDDESVKPLNYNEKKLADTPDALWSESEIKLYGQKKAELPVVQSPDDAAKEEDESPIGIGTIRVREDGRKEQLCAGVRL